MPCGARDVYYAVRSFRGYGKLSRRNIDDLEVGARVERDETKRDPLDFALWKGCTGKDEWGWDEPVGQRAARAGTSSARRWRQAARATASTSTAAGWISSFRTTRTRSRRARPRTRSEGPFAQRLDAQRLLERRQREDEQIARQLRQAARRLRAQRSRGASLLLSHRALPRAARVRQPKSRRRSDRFSRAWTRPSAASTISTRRSSGSARWRCPVIDAGTKDLLRTATRIAKPRARVRARSTTT